MAYHGTKLAQSGKENFTRQAGFCQDIAMPNSILFSLAKLEC